MFQLMGGGIFALASFRVDSSQFPPVFLTKVHELPNTDVYKEASISYINVYLNMIFGCIHSDNVQFSYNSIGVFS